MARVIEVFVGVTVGVMMIVVHALSGLKKA
jgi:hypothetical protein